MEFTCKYAKPSGEVIKAVLVGQNIDEVRHHLQEQGLLPMDIRPRGWSLSLRPRKRPQAIKDEDFILFNQQFVALIRAGLPILKALDLLKDQIRNPLLQHHIVNVRDRVHSGSLLSEALRAQGVFPSVYNSSIFAGERSGNLVEVINRYIQYGKTVLSVRKRFLNSLIYPAFLVVLSIVMVGVILTYVIPKFAQLYADLNTPLPVTTRFLIAVSGAIQAHLVLIVPILVGAAVALKIWAGTGGCRRLLEEQTGSLPGILNHVADCYADDVILRSTALLSWVEPVILIFVAAFIAFVLISLYMLIFSIGTSVQT